MLLRLPRFAGKPPAEWSAMLLDAVTCAVDIAMADVLAHAIWQYDGTNVGPELLIHCTCSRHISS